MVWVSRQAGGRVVCLGLFQIHLLKHWTWREDQILLFKGAGGIDGLSLLLPYHGRMQPEEILGSPMSMTS